MAALQFAIAGAVLAGTWLLLRRLARGGTSLWALPLDVGPILIGWVLLLAVTARPVMSAAAIAAAGAGLALTDLVKRATLREPLVFADRAELLEVVRHPRLYLPFAGPVKVVGGALVAVAAVAGLVWLEPATAHPSPLGPALLAAACLLLPVQRGVLPTLAALYRRLGANGDPASDMRRFGFLGGLVVQATLARAERAGRRAALPALPDAIRPAGPLVLVQVESFFDARRIGPAIPPDLLPAYDRLRDTSVQAGLLDVPCWGANTVRSEFAALTGIGAEALGLDRFNPYERFARQRLPGLAWQMKRAGYRTICLHPFDKRFYGRHRAIPNLGFDAFRGMEAFDNAPRAGLYVTDAAVAAAIAEILRTEGPRVFVFAMTMANHGPWDDAGGLVPEPDIAALPPNLPERTPLHRFLAGLRGSDRMFGALMDAMPPGGTLAVYGDHQPSLPGAFDTLGFTDPRTDYAIWQPGRPPGPPRDMRAEDLPATLLRLCAGVDSPAADLP